jgi:WD40 repeat protein
MSGYRTIHRHVISSQTADNDPAEDLESTRTPIWSTSLSPCNQTHVQTRNSINSQTFAPLRLLTSSADGFVRAFSITDKLSGLNKEALDASALSMKMEQILLPKSCMTYPLSKEEIDNELYLGISTISSTRNYLGEDTKAGGEVSAAIRLDGQVSVWKRDEQPIYPESNAEKEQEVEIVKPIHEFKVQNATGTTLLLIPPQLSGYSKYGVVMMVGCLDGSVVFMCTGVGIPDIKKGNDASKAGEPGMFLDKVGSGSCPVSLAIQSKAYLTFAVGRKNGTIDIYSSYDRNGSSYGDNIFGRFHRCHRLNHHAGSPVRAISYTPDGSLLISGCDDGHIYIHDASSFEKNESILLVASILNAHKSYILSISVLPDSRRFMTSSADKTVKVWDVSNPNSGAVHIFEGNDMIWDLSCSNDGRKCISCSNDGQIQIYSCEL